MSDTLKVARASLHYWEEPSISGERGSGTIFFSGCSMGCTFCQNHEISGGNSGVEITIDRLSEIMFELKEKGAHNINLVTPTHFGPSIAEAISKAKIQGLNIPIVYNTGTYDTAETIKRLDGLVDIYLPDMKYYREETARKFSSAPNYPSISRAAIAEMVRQKSTPIFDNLGMMSSGVIVRILLLPSHVAEAKLILKYIKDTYGNSVYVSLMNQYTPMPNMPPPLNRKVTVSEYQDLLSYAERLGVENGYIQERGTASESFIPSFDGSGII